MSRNKRHLSKAIQPKTYDLSDEARIMTQSQGNEAKNWDRPYPFDGPPGQLFNPGRPIMPLHPDAAPRIFNYRPGYNLMYIPRAAAGLIPFATLRMLGEACYQVRFCIELLKREVRALDWKIVAADDQDKNKESEAYLQKAQEITSWLSYPDGLVDFDSFNNQMLEDLLVTDALSVWPEVSLDGDCITVQQIDGATITPLIDYRGRLPRKPEEPAYLQILYGVPMSWWDSDSLIYKPMNYSINQVYGKSPIENFILMINTMLRHDAFRLGKFTDGNMPSALVGLPTGWTKTQVEQWQMYWDALVSGKVSEQTKIHFLPHDGAGLPVYEFNQSSAVDVELDKFLMTVACWAFGISPSEFGITPGQGLGGSGFMAGMQDIQYRSILKPLTQFMENLWTEIIQKYKAPYLKFKWQGLDPTEDGLKQAQVDQINLTIGKHDIAFVQDRDGIPLVNRPSAPTMQPGSFDANPDGSYTAVPGKSVSMQAVNPMQIDAVNPLEFVPAIDPIQLSVMSDFTKEIKRANDMVEMRKFDESEHPRASDGKFGDKAGEHKKEDTSPDFSGLSGNNAEDLGWSYHKKNPETSLDDSIDMADTYLKENDPVSKDTDKETKESEKETKETGTEDLSSTGKYYRYTHDQDNPMSQWGHAMFADAKDRVEGHVAYGPNAWTIDSKKTTPIESLRDKIIIEWDKSKDSGDWGDGVDKEDESVMSDLPANDAYGLFNPSDIVNSAEAYDNSSYISWLWNKVLEPNGIIAVSTQDGAIAFDPDIIDRHDRK